MTEPDDSNKDDISLTDVKTRRDGSDQRTRDGQSGPVLYQIQYDDGEDTVVRGKSTEIGRIDDSDRMDLEAIQGDQYTHYGIFRLEDRSTVTIVQDESEDLYKIFSLGRNTVKISHPVTITEALD
jgi:hypothetical protein